MLAFERTFNVQPGTLDFFARGCATPLRRRDVRLSMDEGAAIECAWRRAAYATALLPLPALAPATPYRLAPLPRMYTELLARHNNKTRCVFCNKVPEEAALCLAALVSRKISDLGEPK